jgi:hypothetical protein
MDSSEYSPSLDDDDGWGSTIVHLRPGARWAKPACASVVLTCIGISVPPDRAEGAHAVIRAIVSGRDTVLCSLFPRRPTQRARLMWATDQPLILTNVGTVAATLSLLVRNPFG